MAEGDHKYVYEDVLQLLSTAIQHKAWGCDLDPQPSVG